MKRLFILCLVVSGCASISDISNVPRTNYYSSRTYEVNYQVCEEACEHLSTLIEEDGNAGCYEVRNHSKIDIIACSTKCAEKVKFISTNPECWKKLKSCSDFEDQCNNGNLY